MTVLIHLSPTLDELVRIGLDERLANFVLHHPRTGVFAYWCGEAPGGGWPADVPWPYDTPEDVETLYPLWNRGPNLCVVWVRAGRREFVWLDHEGGYEFIARTPRGLLTDLFVTLIEDQYCSTVASREAAHLELSAAAAEIGFQHFEMVWKWVEASRFEPEFWAAKRRLIEQVDDDVPA